MITLLWAAASAALLFLTFFYGSMSLAAISLLVIIIPLLSLLIAIIRAANIELKFYDEALEVKARNRFTLRLALKTFRFLPEPDICVNVISLNRFSGKSITDELSLHKRMSKGLAIIPITMSFEECGLYELSLKRFCIRDYFGIFVIHLPRKHFRGTAQITALPEIKRVPVSVSRSASVFEGDSDVYHPDKKGDDPSEISETRGYIPGDKLRSIHWKQTAKSGELMVKEMAMPIGANVAILLNCSENAGMAIEYAASLSFSLIEQDCIHKLYWNCNNGQRCETIWRNEDIKKAFAEILSEIPLSGTFCDIDESIIIEITPSLEVMVGETAIFSLYNKAKEIVI